MLEDTRTQAENQKMAPDGFFLNDRPSFQEIKVAIESYEKAREIYFAHGTQENWDKFNQELKNINELVERNGGPLYGTYNED